MKLILTLLFLFPLVVHAQSFRLDTIPVAPNDPRNINRNRPLQQQQQPTVDVNLQPINHQQAVEPTTISEEQFASITQQRQPSPLTENLPPFEFDRTRLRLGVHAGLSMNRTMSRNYTAIALGPQLGYVFSDLLLMGVGMKYHHIRINRTSYNVRSNLLGVNIFCFVYPTNHITIFLQPEVNRIWRVRHAGGDRVSTGGVVPVFLIGAGVHFGRFTHITLNYDLVRHRYSPYSDRVFLSITGFF